ncbi:Alpha/Beta hydrolase protein [Baffinella frigidus]|nr:Alpha/Beta hydrolase protein [Cryptophyta sp. CCMP2293]
MLRSKARTGASKGRPMGAISIMDFASLAMPGKTLSEKTLPLDRAKADEMCTGEGYVQASASGPVQTFSDPQHSKGLYYRTFGKGRRKVLMVMGLSASHKGWEYLIPLIVGQDEDTEVCVFDNRGINKFVPEATGCYSMEYLAEDAVAVADHLGWETFHLVGFSMGGMISQVVASMIPARLLSLALLSTTPRRTLLEKLPPASQLYSIFKWCTAVSPEAKAEVDLELHFADAYLDAPLHPLAPPPTPSPSLSVSLSPSLSDAPPLANDNAAGEGRALTVRDFWMKVYLKQQADGQGDPQPSAGMRGQLRALLSFKLKKSQLAAIRANLSCHVLVMQGDQDRMVHPACGPALFRYLTDPAFGAKGAKALPRSQVDLVMLPGAGHFVPIQTRHQVAGRLHNLWASAEPASALAPLPRVAAPTSALSGLVRRLVGRAPQGEARAPAREEAEVGARGQRWVPKKSQGSLEDLLRQLGGGADDDSVDQFSFVDRQAGEGLVGSHPGGGRVAWMVGAS